MQNIDFKNGHLIDIETCTFMQDSYNKAIEAFVAAMEVENCIVSGVKVTENGGYTTVTDGYVVFGGELMEFRGETYVSDQDVYVVKKTETLTNKNYDGNSYPVLKRNYACLGFEGEGGVPLSDIIDFVLRPSVSNPYKRYEVRSDYAVDSDSTAKMIGFSKAHLASLNCQSRDNYVWIGGAVHVNNADLLKDPMFRIVDWCGKKSMIKCTVLDTEAGKLAYSYPGTAHIWENGEVKLDSTYASQYPIAVIFDYSLSLLY